MLNHPLIQRARAVLATEAEAILRLGTRLDVSFVHACELMLACSGRVIVSGMGKSGHIGGKIAATLASTGTPAFFLHPGEASHGDLGMVTRQDVLLMLSNSGETPELLAILPPIKRMGIPIIAVTGRSESTLAREATIHLDASVEQEACPLGLAPTASTTAALALGDALAVTLLEARGFTAEDFALSHPGGALGRRLLVLVRDVMHSGDDLPVVAFGAPLRDALMEITRKGLGITAVVDEQGVLTGVFTDGDLRRALDHKTLDLRAARVDDIYTPGGKTCPAHMLAAEALGLMERTAVNALIVVDEQQRPIGAFNTHDLLRAGVI
ncbi:MAG: D-arabinose 5-phosphate isomerase [Gammaproteobacteria bacterium 28-57-27]|nr:MAG: D-arabinose 5-phosphate isomerase [Gammaproteobacteria bacterium 28-57-27]